MEKVFIVGFIMSAAVLFPMSVAHAIRMLKRETRRTPEISSELADRMSRMEAAIDATALEVERIGEGQRFVTRLLTEANTPSLLAPSSQSALLDKTPRS